MSFSVLMVCTGNICRSVMAEQILREAAADSGVDILVDSAGISDEEHGHGIDSRAARALREGGYRVPSHRARQVQAGELQRWDLILAMTSSHLRALERLAGGPDPKIRMFRDFEEVTGKPARGGSRDVPDPWYGTMEDFVETLDVVERVCDAVAPALVELSEQRQQR